MALTPSNDLVSEVLAGRVRGIARMMSRAEAGAPECRPALAEIYRHTGKAHVVGLTGVPGSGKSTLARSLARAIRESNRKVGIVAVDPSSPFSGGAILGDRVRMNELASDPGVFIRSMATRGVMGGLAQASLDAVDILDAAGFDVVLVETVGVGQDEVDIVQAAHTVIVVSAPGLGDEIQSIKAGILEIADIHAVSKCDRPDANKVLNDLKAMLALDTAIGKKSDWAVPVLPTSAERNEGIGDLLSAIIDHKAHLEESDGVDRRRRIVEMRIFKTAEEVLRSRFTAQREGKLSEVIERVMAREMDPYTAAMDLLAAFYKD
ncbi:MAG: methylmalonyl Co-A mutase-associated GTPase MeaB [bacterium]|nr:methylmalonyl Co-A mutase-associated GTPase MeaB [bacterium]